MFDCMMTSVHVRHTVFLPKTSCGESPVSTIRALECSKPVMLVPLQLVSAAPDTVPGSAEVSPGAINLDRWDYAASMTQTHCLLPKIRKRHRIGGEGSLLDKRTNVAACSVSRAHYVSLYFRFGPLHSPLQSKTTNWLVGGGDSDEESGCGKMRKFSTKKSRRRLDSSASDSDPSLKRTEYVL